MSYCVNCGVELESTEKKCPLCGVEVVNPRVKEVAEDKKTFPEMRDELKKIDRIFWINFYSILFGVLIITCVLCNLMYDRRLTWSVFVIAGVFMLWVFCTSPLYFRKFDYRKMMSADLLAVLAGLILIESQVLTKGWFLFVALPIVLYCYLSWMIMIYLTKKKVIRGLSIAAVFLISIALMMCILEILLDLYATHSIMLTWSGFVIAPCLSVAVLLMVLDKNKQVKQELSKRLHF